MHRPNCILIYLLILSSSCFAKIPRHKDSKYLNHVQFVRQFKCEIPQSRAVPVAELLSIGPGPDEIFYPASTVLARCNGAGCCPRDTESCRPIEIRNISLVFLVKHFDKQRDRHHEIIRTVEHTKCQCMNKYDE